MINTSNVVTTTAPGGPHSVLSTPALSANAPAFAPGSIPTPTGGTTSTNSTVSVGTTAGLRASQQSTGGGEAMEPVSTLAAAPLDALSVALLAHQLPTLPNFNGEDLEGDGESFGDWLECLELVASTCKWDDQAKLMNVATRLRGTASRFYRSCTPQQRSSYKELVAALCNRFTPVYIQSVQSSIFHERKQCTNENVDDYAQDLCKLFNRAYSNAQSGGEAEAMGKSVLSNQFVAGLVDKLKAKMVGQTGTFEEVLAQARFEEARLKNTTASREGAQPDHQTRKKFDSNQSQRGSGEAQHTQPVYSSAEDISRVFLVWWHWAFRQRMPPSWKRSPNGGKGKE